MQYYIFKTDLTFAYATFLYVYEIKFLLEVLTFGLPKTSKIF